MTKPTITSPRVLFWDIETSLQTAAVFKLFGEDYINHENLIQERYIICASWKWAGDKKVESVSILDDPKLFAKDPFSDYHVCKVLYEVLSQADVIVAHNGDGFDLKYLRTRLIINGFPPLPPVATLDTLKTARSLFMFNSNRLDYLGKILGVGRKIKTSPGLWLKMLQGDFSGMPEMVKYNKQDVLLLEDVFNKLAPHMPNHINRELFGQKVGCPRCGSKHVQSRGLHRAITKVYQRFQCQSCHGWFKSIKAEPVNAATSRAL